MTSSRYRPCFGLRHRGNAVLLPRVLLAGVPDVCDTACVTAATAAAPSRLLYSPSPLHPISPSRLLYPSPSSPNSRAVVRRPWSRRFLATARGQCDLPTTAVESRQLGRRRALARPGRPLDRPSSRTSP